MAPTEGAGKKLQPTEPPTVVRRSRARTVHVVGRLTPEVFSFLLPATQAIGAADGLQTVVVIDDEFSRTRLAELHPNIALALVADHRSPMARMRAIHESLDGVASRSPIAALHLHGVLPGLAGALLVRRRGLTDVEVFLSPHSSRALVNQSLLGAPLRVAIRALLGANARRLIVNLNADSRWVKSISDAPVKLVESAVPDDFFRTARNEAETPLLLASGRGESDAPASSYARLAVLMGDGDSGMRFAWMGAVDDATTSELRAAGIMLVQAPDAPDRARRLSEAWVYVAAEQERGFPVSLVEAMASGLPCVAIDSEVHRDILQNGSTGFVCADHSEMMTRIAALVDSAELRQRFGNAARQAARERFSELVFHRRLLKAYEPEPEAAPVPAEQPVASSVNRR